MQSLPYYVITVICHCQAGCFLKKKQKKTLLCYYCFFIICHRQNGTSGEDSGSEFCFTQKSRFWHMFERNNKISSNIIELFTANSAYYVLYYIYKCCANMLIQNSNPRKHFQFTKSFYFRLCLQSNHCTVGVTLAP